MYTPHRNGDTENVIEKVLEKVKYFPWVGDS